MPSEFQIQLNHRNPTLGLGQLIRMNQGIKYTYMTSADSGTSWTKEGSMISPQTNFLPWYSQLGIEEGRALLLYSTAKARLVKNKTEITEIPMFAAKSAFFFLDK